MKEGENPVVILPPKETPKEKVVENQKLSEKFLGPVRNLFKNIFEFLKHL